MRLGFHYHIPAIQQDGQIKMPGYLGLFVDSLAVRCERIVCFQHSPREDELLQMDYEINNPNISLVAIGPHNTVPLRTAAAFFNRQVFRSWQSSLDILLVRVPTPLLPVISLIWKKPLTLLIVGDYLPGIDDLPQPRWRKELIRIWAKWVQSYQLRTAKRSLTFVNSRLLYEQYLHHIPNLVETRTTTIRENQIFPRYDTCKAPPYRLLYAGRMSRSKGLFEMVKALALLVDAGFDVILDLVGMEEEGYLVLDELDSLANSIGVAKRVQYHGYKSAGTELLTYYRRADIFIIASQSSFEGFPRVIWEAMASGLPVVATQVGSIPAYIGNAAVLVPPRNSDVLVQAICNILENKDLRQKLIRNGMKLAQENTLEKRADEMITHIERWLGSGIS